ncbi:substrate-binding periplasmic protein [Pseudomonas profundi]|uniref:substrate-binding periplasmic protein n=1 Tax=Pseudomonas profundi TaxID=1981513 RepID=UPI00123AEAD4|nr:hypothetical protein [Pseudomonas profundi]
MKGMIGGMAVLMACWIGSAGADEMVSDPPEVQPRPMVEVALMDFPGYAELNADGEIVGKTVRLTARLLEQAGYPYHMRILPAARIWRGLKDGSVDIWPGTLTRSGGEYFTLQTDRSLGLVGIHLYYRPGEPAPVWPEGLHGKRLILMMNHLYTRDLLGVIEDPALEVAIHRASSHAGSVKMLLRGRGDYLLHYRSQVGPVVAQMGIDPLPSLRIVELPMRFVLSQRSGFAEQLKADLDRAYDELAKQGAELNVTRQ